MKDKDHPNTKPPTTRDMKTTSTTDSSNRHKRIVTRSIIYGVVDTHGNTDWDTTSDPSNTIQICGLKNRKGEDLHFESEAYHLAEWCEENDLRMERREVETIVSV